MYNYFFLILGSIKMDLTFSDSDLSFRKEVVSFLENEYPSDIKEKQDKRVTLEKEEIIRLSLIHI